MVENPSLVDMNPAMPAKDIRFVNVDVPKGIKVINAEVSYRGGVFGEIK